MLHISYGTRPATKEAKPHLLRFGDETAEARASLATSRSLSASHKTRGHGPTVIEQSPLELVVSTIWGRAILMTGARVIRCLPTYSSALDRLYNFAWEKKHEFLLHLELILWWLHDVF